MNEIQSKFINYLVKIYPNSIVKNILDENTLTILEKEAKIEVKEVDHGFKDSHNLKKKIIEYGKPCRICDEQGYIMTHQEFPGWSGPLQKKNLIVIGGEISPKKSNGFHIAYNLFNKNPISEAMNENLNKIIYKFQERAYITDLAKCYCTDKVNRPKCRKLCKPNLINEIKILFEIHKKWILIFQGKNILEYFKEYQTEYNLKISRTFEEKSKTFYLFIAGTLKIDSIVIPYIVFPHVSPRNRTQWIFIKKKWDEYRYLVKNGLKTLEFNFIEPLLKESIY